MINREGTKKLVRSAVITIIVCIIIGYAYFATQDYILGPQITISEPANGSTISTSTVLLKGRALLIQNITLNNRPILIDEQGNFSEMLLLFPGYNVSLISARDKFDRTIEYKLELVYQDKP
ncbi:MAG: hypothetical protein AAB610_00805 [Patescibacteria group bacterium]